LCLRWCGDTLKFPQYLHLDAKARMSVIKLFGKNFVSNSNLHRSLGIWMLFSPFLILYFRLHRLRMKRHFLFQRLGKRYSRYLSSPLGGKSKQAKSFLLFSNFHYSSSSSGYPKRKLITSSGITLLFLFFETCFLTPEYSPLWQFFWF